MSKYYTAIAFLFLFNLTALPQPYITVTFPNGGEIFCCGGMDQNITWESNGSCGSVQIQLWQGGVFHSIIVASAPNDGIFTWSCLPGSGESEYSIKIVSACDTNIFDFSGTFTFGCDINIISPNGGETWETGSFQTLSWTSNIGGNVKIDFYKGGSFHSIITGSTTNDSSVIWTIPYNIKSGSDYSVKISSIDNPNVFDFSDANFSITGEYIILISPNGGVFCDGIGPVTWESNMVGAVAIQLYKNGDHYITIVASTPNDGFYTWNIPGSGSGYQIKILSTADPNIFDISDSTFTIGCNIINIISPNGGEEWETGSSQTITWESNIAGNVKIELYKGGLFHSIITGSTTNDSSMIWTIPFNIKSGSDYKIKIFSIINQGLFDYSDAEFTITNVSGIENKTNGIPDIFTLYQNYPNPFNPGTTIYYGLPEAGYVELAIYDVLGNEVINYRESQTAGYHKFEFDGSDLNSGVYFYRLQVYSSNTDVGNRSAISRQSFIKTKKMILIK